MKLYLKAPPALKRQEKKFWPLVLMGVGSFLMVFVSGPIIAWELMIGPNLTVKKWLSPAGGEVSGEVRGAEVVASEGVDYTQASTWFPAAVQASALSKITHYTVDIPSLKIKNSVVEIGGEDLKSSLIQYGGTANPGELGVAVIFGHSILRQFYNPSETNPNRYVSIFSTIMTLKEGEPILVNYDGIKYTYRVVRKYQVEPEDIDVLGQRYDQKMLRLITCVPEGTYLHRGVVEAVLESS